MQDITIWHNAKCSKSRAALELLKNKDLNLNIVTYLENTPTKEELVSVLKMLDFNSARELMRTKEDIYISLNVKDITSEDELINIMIENPILIERPVIIKEGKAVIARPLENINKL